MDGAVAPRRVVVFTAYNRPDYMRQTLDSWVAARGVSATVLDFHVDDPNAPSSAPVRDMCSAVDFGRPVSHPNNGFFGVQRNPHEALKCGFASFPVQGPGDFVILAEDDMLVSTDILEYFRWCSRRFHGDDRALCVSACQWRRRAGSLAAVYPYSMSPGPYLWVWGTWRDRWESLLAPDWTFNYEHEGWDWRIYRHWVQDQGYRVVTPAVSRCQHIGQYGGTHMNPSEHVSVQSDCFVRAIPRQRYKVVT